MKRTLTGILVFALLLSVGLGLGGAAEAAGTIYVNDSQGTLVGEIGTAYVVGANDEVSTAAGNYVITGDGVLQIGQATTPDVTDPGEDGSTVKLKTNVARVGLNYYYSSGRDTSLSSASLENKVGSGYKFGYFDANRVFQELGSTAEKQITMTPSGSGRGVAVTKTGTSTVLYQHSDTSVNLAVRPVSNSGKAVTWFKGIAYYGDFEYYRYVPSKLTVINVVNLEDYLKGVVPTEMSPSWPIEALKAQAICARTYFAKSIGSYGKYGFDVTGDTYSQAYTGTSRATANSDAAVDQTAGKYVTYNGALCTTFYFSSDGGGTESSENIFETALPYCRGIIDPYEEAIPSFGYKTWSYSFTAAEIATKLRSYGISNVASVEPTYSPTNNVIKLTVTDVNGNKATLAKSSCYSVLGLPSVHYTVTKSPDNPDVYIFNGSGWGHNVGMSQWGAYSMAKYYGMNYRQIISFYFTGVKISTGIL